LTAGDVDTAVEHLREAVHQNLALGHFPALVRSRLRYAEALNARMHPSDEAAAYRQFSAAAEETSMLGLPAPRDLTPWLSRQEVVCTRLGRRWQLELGGRSVVVEHCVGMLHLAVLVANPGIEITAIDLVTGVNVLATVDGGRMSVQPVLDRVAIGEYRQRLSRLYEQIDELEMRGDASRLAHARAEREWLVAELAAGNGIGGRARPFPDDRERARVAVGKAIRRALTRICEADAVVGEHLRDHIQTGTRCSYRPH
jgi:hypothetical protein